MPFYEIVAISAMCAVGILTIASLIGASVAYLMFRERAPHTAAAHGMAPAGATPVQPAFGGTPTVAVG